MYKKTRIATRGDFETPGTYLINQTDSLVSSNVYKVQKGWISKILYIGQGVILRPLSFGEEEVFCEADILGNKTKISVVYSNCIVVEKL